MTSTPLPLAAAPARASRRGLQASLLPLAVAVLLALLPSFLSSYGSDLVLRIMVYAIFALSLELLVGMTGLVSLGHAGFFGIGAYVTVLASGDNARPSRGCCRWPCGRRRYALVVGALCLRTRGVYFIMVTLAFAQMAYFVFHDTPIGGGSDGIYLNLRPVPALGGAPARPGEPHAHVLPGAGGAGGHLRACWR